MTIEQDIGFDQVLVAGDVHRWPVTLYEDDETTEIDLSTVTVTAAAYGIWHPRTGELLASKTMGDGISINTGENRVVIELAKADTATLAGKYRHELELVIAGDARTWFYGHVQFARSVVETGA